MRNWIVSQGWQMYLMIGMSLIGVLGCILSRWFFGRIAKEAQICGTTSYPMFHYIRQKYISYYKIGIRPTNSKAMVRRYLMLHKVGVFSLNVWKNIKNLMIMTILLEGIVVGLYRYYLAYAIKDNIIFMGTSLVGALTVYIMGMIFNVDNQYGIAENAVCDYLDNYLRSKLDGEYGFGQKIVSPEHYEDILKETKTGKENEKAMSNGRLGFTSFQGNTRKSELSRYGKNTFSSVSDSRVDAKIVEDVLKEFLC